MNAQESPTEPIACTLGAGAYKERLAWMAELNRSALQGVRQEGTRLILTYDPRVIARIQEMVRRERKCCEFLQFEMNEGVNGLTLVITAPEAAREAIDAIFDPFATGSKSSGGGGCACATVRQ